MTTSQADPLNKVFLVLALLIIAFMAVACATSSRYLEGRSMVESGNVEEGLAVVGEELAKDPGNVEIRNFYKMNKIAAVQRYLRIGDNARQAGSIDQAEVAYQRAQKLDPENELAQAGLDAVAKERAVLVQVKEAQEAFKKGETDRAYAKAKEVLATSPAQRDARGIVRKIEEQKMREANASPQLSAALKKPITMEFRDAPLRTVFELISKRTGLNFVFDRDVPPDAKSTVFVRDTGIDEVIRYVLVTNQLDKRVLNENTILIYPNTPQKTRDYKDLVVRSFYLANADAKQTATMVRQLVKTRDLYVDEKLNLLVMRDTPEAIAMAEKLVANQDLGEAEVMLEVEVLEVGYNKLQSLGIQWPTQIGAGVAGNAPSGGAGVPGQLTGHEALHFNSGLVRLTIDDPVVQLNAKQQNARTNVLANPRIRVKNREKAKIHIGDRVPVITTTAGATGFVSESVNYLDVGLKLEVEPQVYLEDDVGIKIGLEVSTIAQQIKTSAGTTAYQVSTRNANTVLRLRDGETQVLAGLINDEDRRSANRVPGFADLPVLGRLFSQNDDTVNKTEVVLLITPRVVRNVERPGVRLEQFSSGTEAEVGGASLALPSVGAPNVQPAITAPPSQPYQSQPTQPAPPAPSPEAPPASIPPAPPAAGPQPKPAAQ
jgi:general secretion pathway protein D